MLDFFAYSIVVIIALFVVIPLLFAAGAVVLGLVGVVLLPVTALCNKMKPHQDI